jgi:hypothetical protein
VLPSKLILLKLTFSLVPGPLLLLAKQNILVPQCLQFQNEGAIIVFRKLFCRLSNIIIHICLIVPGLNRCSIHFDILLLREHSEGNVRRWLRELEQRHIGLSSPVLPSHLSAADMLCRPTETQISL